MYACMYVCMHACMHKRMHMFRARPGQPRQRREREERREAGAQGFQGHGFHLSTSHFEILQETYGLNIFVFCCFRIGAP